jgi:glycine/D-amino acid oxidase-like deaminating enzyme
MTRMCGERILADTAREDWQGGDTMRIVILGGGVVGVTTAYQLQKVRHGLTARRNDRRRPSAWRRAGARRAWRSRL